MKHIISKCMSCDTRAYDSPLCAACCKSKDIREAFGIKIPSDYSLSKDDWMVNALAFVHACGALPSFLDKVHSEVSEMMMAPFDRLRVDPVSLLSDEVLLSYDEKEFYGYHAFASRNNKTIKNNSDGSL